MRRDDQIAREDLRRLNFPEPGAIRRALDPALRGNAFDGVPRRQSGHGGSVRGRGIDAALDQIHRHERPRGIVDCHQIGSAGNFFQAAAGRLLPRRAAYLQNPWALFQRRIAAQHRLTSIEIGGAHHQNHAFDPRRRKHPVEGAQDQRTPGHFEIAL